MYMTQNTQMEGVNIDDARNMVRPWVAIEGDGLLI
jgi:hypothetical protein